MLKDTAKRSTIEKQLSSHPELEYTIWKAVEGRKLSEDEQRDKVLQEFFTRYGRNATLPAVGCALSHIGIYQEMINSNTEYALILEDDAILSNNLYLGSMVKLLESDNPVVILLTPDFWYRMENKVMKVDETHDCFSLTNGYMASGYIINKKASEMLIPLNTPVKYVADEWAAFVKNGLKLYGIVPHVISYPDGCGEIGRSQSVRKTTYEKLRAILVKVYIKYLNAKSFLKGNRKSRKLWK